MRHLHGIVPPLVTPLAEPDRLDLDGLDRLIEHVLAGGVHGLFILGTTGEGPSLSYRLRREMIQRVCCQVNGRVPVLVGITDTALSESVALACVAAEAGSDMAVAAPPYYFPAGQPELARYIEVLSERLPLPLMLYNMPALTKIRFELPTLRRLMNLETVVGLKDSSGDLAYFREVVELRTERPDWPLFIGPEELLAEAVSLGADGGVSGGANLRPDLFVDLYDALLRGDALRIAHFERQIAILGEIYRIGLYGSAVIKGLKCALSLKGLCSDTLAEPFEPFAPPGRLLVQTVLNGLSAAAEEFRPSPGG